MTKFWPSLSLSLGIAFFLSILFYFGFFNSWQEKLTDKLFLEQRPPANIALIAIDDESLSTLGQWPWPRQIHSQLLNILKQDQPKLVVWDINFFEDSRLGSQDDQLLAQALKNVPSLLTIEAPLLRIESDQIPCPVRNCISNGAWANFLIEPIGDLKKEAVGLGHINTLVDDDGILRKIPLYIEYQNGYIQALALSALCQLNNLSVADCSNPEYIFSQFGLQENNLRINYLGPPETFPSISYSQVLANKISPGFFKDKIVFIGATAPDLHDTEMTPVSSGLAMAGIEIQANALQTLLTQNFLSELNRYLVIGLIFLMSLLGWLVVLLNKKIWLIILCLGLILVFYNFFAIWFFEKGIIFNLFYPNLSLLLTTGGTVSWSYIQEQKQRRKIHSMFSRFLDKNVIEELLTFKNEAELRAARLKNMTILFSDIQGFTNLAEKMKPKDLADFLNEYFTAMTNIILEERGVIDKYIGDAIMAFWGAPLDLPDHAERACSAALRMIDRLDILGEQWEKQGLPKLNIRIGIHTDKVVVGNIGSSLRFDYTVIGDGVNLASRLEGLNKEYGTNIIISQTTYELVKDKFKTKSLGTSQIKGKEKEQLVYQLVGVLTKMES